MNLAVPDTPIVSRLAPSPNHGARPEAGHIDAIILHYTGLREDACAAWMKDPGGEALRWLCSEASQVSSHYLIERDGAIIQLVAESRRAWHAGQGSWKDCRDLNSCSIGIEIVNTGHAGGLPTYPVAQIDAVIALCKDIARRRAIAPERVLAHSDIAPGRKIDPGEHFPWRTLAIAGVGHWVEPLPLSEDISFLSGEDSDAVRLLRDQLATYGYAIGRDGVFDDRMVEIVRAFQRHFRQARVDGVADESTRSTLARLIEALSSSAGA